ncbi:hypothetical protein PENSPDRAFT_685820 [Peniophora sp. CONT]|nr:hypothetical protein PENSPDRAFT_685820 [Peniophora sp. CONT]
MTQPSPPSLQLILIDGYVRPSIYNFHALSSIFGHDEAVRIVSRVVLRAWKQTPADTRPTVDVFTLHNFTRLWAIPGAWQHGLPPDYVAFLADPPVKHFNAPLYYGIDLVGRYIVDASLPIGYRGIPSTPFAPYSQISQQRYESILEHLDHMPIWFFERGPGGHRLGVPLETAVGGDVQMLNDVHELDDLRDKKSLKLKFNWPNYPSSEKQIRSPMHTLNRLVKLTAGAVRNFMHDSEGHKLDSALQQWSDIGTGPGEVNVGTVLLLGIHFVSDGAAMPLLATQEQE